MDGKEQRNRELIVGYDLCDNYSQISYFNYEQAEPKTISIMTGEEKYQIPTILLKKEGVDKWYFGEDAQKKVVDEAFIIKNIVSRCRNEETSVIEGIEFKPEDLLEIFLKKTFNFFDYEGLSSKIPDIIVFTVENINDNLVRAIKLSAKAIGIKNENIYIQDHEDSFVEYSIHQKKELWNYKVILLEYTKESFKALNLKINTKTTPVIATIDKKEFSSITSPQTMFVTDTIEVKNSKLDVLIRDTLKNYFGKEMISCIFLCGECFDGDWFKETLRLLCSGRRVFQGKNLFTKGACYQAAKKVIQSDLEDHLFLGNNKLKFNVGLDVFYKGESQYYSMILASENWYDAHGECELILDNESCVELICTPIDNKDTRSIIVKLHELPDRPNKTIRICVQVRFESAKFGKVTIKDLGFGEFYESSGKTWNHEICL
ncbi:MAG: DUF5716 family protein [Lachnotalea sp.]